MTASKTANKYVSSGYGIDDNKIMCDQGAASLAPKPSFASYL